jgi:WD40 repeat protein
LGVILYQHLTGGVPFTAANTAELIRKIQFQPPPSIRERAPDVSRDLETITMKCLAKRPEERYLKASDLADELRRYLRGEPILTRPIRWPVRMIRLARQRPMQTMLLAVSLMLFLAAAAAAVMFQQNAIQKSDLARVAEEKRDQAVAAQEKEQQLRLAAEAAKVDAEDAARFAEAHQLKAEFTTLEVYRENGTLSKNLEEISRIAALPGGSAVDTQWYLRQAQREVPVLARFNTADWGLYDVAVDAQRKRMVTCDRTGQISTWDLEKYQLVQMLTEVPVCPKTRIAFPRIRYHQLPQRPDITFGFVPDKLPDWYSSVAFSKEGAVLATTLDGRLIKFNGSESDQQKEIYRAESPLLLVRTNVAANQIALADKSGQIQLLDADGKPRCRFQLRAEPSLLAYRSSSGWVVGTVDGQVVLLDENLSELASLDLKQRIHDACTYSHFGQELILVAAGESAVQSWRLQAKQEKNSVENDDKQNVSNSEGLNRKQNEESEKESRDEKDKKLSDPQQFDLIEVQLYQQLKREEHHEFHRLLPDESSGQLIVLDNAGCPWVWDLESGKFLHTIFLTPRTDIRALPSDKAALVLDQLEARSPWFLHRGHQGILRFDCIGGVIEVSVDHIKKTQELWKPLAVNVGVQPRMVADPNSTTRVWSLSCIGDLMLFDTLADQVLGRVEKAHAGGYCDLSVFPNGDAITAGNDSWLRVWRYVDGKVREIRKLEGPGHLLSVAISPNERLAASVNSHGKLLVFEIQSGRLIQQLAFVDPSSEDVSSDSNAKNNLPSVTVNRVATGRLAFSKSGKFLAAFGTNQKFEVFDTETWNRVDLTHINIAGAGGVDVVFSPVEERRMVTASHDTSVNIVASQTPKIDQRMPVGAHPKSARQLVTTVLGDRILALNETGFIQSLSGLHFVHLASIPIPTREPWSLALTGADSGLVVGDAQGKVYYCQTQQQVPVEDSGRAVEGIVHELLRPGEETFFTTGDWLGLSPKRDANGHLCDVFVRGGLTDKSQELKLCLLQKREGVWRLERPRFQGDETGPCEHASLFIRPDNSRMVLIRQGLKGEYNGRLIAVYDDGSDNWPTEVILDRGNMGFSAYPRFGDDSRLQSVLHFDYSLQGLMHSSRKSEPGNWELQTVHAWAGQGLNGVQDSKGVHHLLMRRMRGWDGGLVMAMRLSPQGEMISFNGRGRWIYWAPRDRVLSFEPAEGILWELQNDQSWSPLARLPQLSGGCRPCISPDGWLWLAEPAGTSLSVYALQLSKVPTGTHIDLNDTQAGMEHWKRGKITFTGQVPSEPAVGTACHINDLGCLEVIVARLGGRSSLAVVEAVSPLRLDPEQQP